MREKQNKRERNLQMFEKLKSNACETRTLKTPSFANINMILITTEEPKIYVNANN